MTNWDIQWSGGGSGPVYRQIAGAIEEAIEKGRIPSGARLPAIRALAQQLEVNRDTVALAYESLAEAGLVESAVGRGTFVCSRGLDRVEAIDPPAVTSEVERLLALENARPRFGGGAGVVQMHALVPDPSLYPVDDFRKSVARAVAEEGASLFLYGEAQGHGGLRRVLADRYAAAGVPVKPEEIVLCHGASQGIALALRLFARTGDRVAIEVPTYANVLTALAGLGLEWAPVAMTASGPDLEAVDRTLAQPDVKAFYSIPTFHNPMGITTSLAHRQALLEIARRHGKPIIEDAFEMDLRIGGQPVSPLAALDCDGFVVRLHSFSKSLFPGLRVGSMVARGRALDGLVALKQATDLSDALLLQAALAHFISEGAYDRHLNRMRRTLRERHAALDTALAQTLPEGTVWTRPEGGYQVWVELPFEVDTRDLLPEASRAGVLFAPGSQFMPDGRPSRCLRLTLARANADEIKSGLAALGRVVAARAVDQASARPAPGVMV
ncbi:MAG: PLP-dependent aminotransferase family protein [Myxococcota bacterium]|nr:PLP-dependent aminotransferase family protein [Myxococcota bacterium]